MFMGIWSFLHEVHEHMKGDKQNMVFYRVCSAKHESEETANGCFKKCTFLAKIDWKQTEKFTFEENLNFIKIAHHATYIQ